MVRPIGAVTLAVSMTFGLFGQRAQQPRAFDVASVKPRQGPLSRLGIFSSSGPLVTLEGYSKFALVMEAYKLKQYQVSFAPSVPQRDYEYYDIVAKAEGDGVPTRSEFRQMEQTLLAERFHLEIHREMKEMPVYALMVGKNGPKFKESAPDAVFSGHGGVNGRNQYMERTNSTMEDLADTLGIYADRPIVDKTGLTGNYDYRIEATPWFRLHNGSEDLNDITVFTAVQEQLGLKLEAQKAPIEIVVVDHMENPTEN